MITFEDMKKLFCIAVLGLFSSVAFSQSTHDFMIGGAFDVIKTDNNGVFNKSQIGLEANYFIIRHFAVGAGAEIWAKQKDSFVMGMRWYFNDHVFTRFRALVGANDASLGLGYAYPLKPKIRLEAMGDYYFSGKALGIRGGISFILK